MARPRASVEWLGHGIGYGMDDRLGFV